MEINTYISYWKDLIFLFKEQADKAKTNFHRSKSDFDSGYLMACYTLFDLIKQQAKAFNIPEKDLFIENINPDDYLSKN